MSNVTQLRTREERLQEAADWVARFDRGLRDDEQRAMKKWLDQGAANRDAMLFMLDVWDKSDSLARLSELFPEPVRRRDRFRPVAWIAGLATAATAVVATVLLSSASIEDIPSVGEATAEPSDSQILETLIGARKIVELADGSTVDLNTNSLIDVRFTEDRRWLRLQRGEATFTVSHDPHRPFVVVVGETEFEALGTEFNLEIRSEQRIELVVTDGSVRVAARSQRRGGTVEAQPGRPLIEPVLVEAGQEFTVGGASRFATMIDSADIAARLSWRNDNLIFRGATMGDALTEIGRYTTVEFVFLDDELRSEPVVGMFKIGDVQGTLNTLENNFGIQYELANDNRVLLSRKN